MFALIKVVDVNKSLGDKKILNDININVEEGSIFGLIGPNGVGKTTLIKCLTGIYQIDKGSIRIAEQEVYENTEVKKIIGYVADDNSYFSNQKVKEIVKFYELAYDTFSRERFDELNKEFNLSLKTTFKKLSKGMRMQLAIMLNLSIMPKLLIMDEPTSGLDPIVKKKVMNIILDDVAERGTTVFISSHNLSDLERICDSVAIINKGEIKFSDSIENMKNNIRKLQVVFKDTPPEDFKNWTEILSVSNVGRVYTIVTCRYDDAFKNKLQNCNITFEEEIDLSLEDMFIYSVEGGKYFEEIL